MKFLERPESFSFTMTIHLEDLEAKIDCAPFFKEILVNIKL